MQLVHMQHASHMPSMMPHMPYVQHNTAIRDGLNCFRTFTSKYSEPSINNCNYFSGLGCLPKTNVDEESSSCITPVTMPETGRDEMTDSGSDPEYDLCKKQDKQHDIVRDWYEKKGYENITEPKNEKRGKQKKPKAIVTVDSLGKSDLLRQAILEYVFRLTGRSVTLDQVLKLTARHEKEKIIRFNEICLQHIVTYCIEEKCGKKKNHFPLCIDKCPHCPVQNIANNKAEWFCVKSQNPSLASQELREYTSSYSKKHTRGQSNDVVKYSDLRLNVCLYNANATHPAISQQHKVKVMKGEYFTKIRTATPKAPTQPLNLTYARFWVEVVKDCVYLCIVDVEALKAYDEKQGTKRPIKSAIGAYVDGRMEVELAIMSAIPDTEIVFEWFVHKNYVNQWFRDGLTLGLHLTGNKEIKDWTWYQTVRDTNIFVHNNIGHNQWPPMEYGLSGAPFNYQLPPQIIQPINNSYEQVCAEASYKIPETIASGMAWQPIPDFANGAPISVSATATPSPTLNSFQGLTLSCNFDTIRTEAIQGNNEPCQKRCGTKRKRSEMESETEGAIEHIMEIPAKRPVGPYQAFYQNELTLFEETPCEESPHTSEWCPEMDPMYNRLGSSQ